MDDEALLNALKHTKGTQSGRPKGSPADSNVHRDSGNGISGNLFTGSLMDEHGVIDPIKVIPALEMKMPAIKTVNVTEGTNLTTQQRKNIEVIAYTLDVHLGEAIEADRIHSIWPVKKNTPNTAEGRVELNQAGPRPSLTAITYYLGSERFRDAMSIRGVAVGNAVGQLTAEQIALISILTDTSSKATIGTRLKRAGIAWPVYHAWRRQKLFAQALQEAAGGALNDAIENSDVQLARLAQEGDLNAMKYLNEMVGRSPNDKKAVDAMQFAKIILEVVQKRVSSEQAGLIAADIALAAKKIGLD